MGVLASQTEVKEEKEEEKEECQDALDNSRQYQQRQINLLDHIDAVQDEVSHRMDFIEKELDGERVSPSLAPSWWTRVFWSKSAKTQHTLQWANNNEIIMKINSAIAMLHGFCDTECDSSLCVIFHVLTCF